MNIFVRSILTSQSALVTGFQLGYRPTSTYRPSADASQRYFSQVANALEWPQGQTIVLDH
jgi:hypothetical protein